MSNRNIWGNLGRSGSKDQNWNLARMQAMTNQLLQTNGKRAVMMSVTKTPVLLLRLIYST